MKILVFFLVYAVASFAEAAQGDKYDKYCPVPDNLKSGNGDLSQLSPMLQQFVSAKRPWGITSECDRRMSFAIREILYGKDSDKDPRKVAEKFLFQDLEVRHQILRVRFEFKGQPSEWFFLPGATAQSYREAVLKITETEWSAQDKIEMIRQISSK